MILINGFHFSEQNSFRFNTRNSIGDFVLFRGDASDVNADGVVNKEGALDIPEGAASLGGLASLDEPRRGGAVVGTKQYHWVGVATRWAHDGEDIRGGNKVDDEGGILEGVSADEVAMLITVDKFEGAALDLFRPF